MKRLTTLTVALLCALSASTASADELVAETNISTFYPSHHSYDLISDRNALSTWQLGIGWQFDRLAGVRTLFIFDTTVPGRLTSSRFAGDLYTEWGRQRFMAAAEYGPQLFDWFRPFARVGAGYAHQFLSLETTGPRLKDNAHDLALTGSGGLEFSIPIGIGALGLHSQFGYQWQTPATFDELRHDKKAFDDRYEDYEDGDPWTRERSDIGSLRTDSLFWDIGIHMRFFL